MRCKLQMPNSGHRVDCDCLKPKAENRKCPYPSGSAHLRTGFFVWNFADQISQALSASKCECERSAAFFWCRRDSTAKSGERNLEITINSLERAENKDSSSTFVCVWVNVNASHCMRRVDKPPVIINADLWPGFF